MLSTLSLVVVETRAGLVAALSASSAAAVGDLARVVDCSATPSIPVLKSPKQTMQVSDIRGLYTASCIRKQANVVAVGVVDDRGKQRVVQRRESRE